MKNFDITQTMNKIWSYVGEMDKYIQENKPFQMIKEDKERGKEMILSLVMQLYDIASKLEPFMPETSEKIIKLIEENKKPETPLFLRKD